MGYREVPGIGSIDIENVEWRRMRIGDRVYEYPRPYEISIEVTHNCPAYCLMCSSNSRCVWREGRLEGELLSVEIIQLLGAAKALGAEVVSWSGGEPLIRHDMSVIMAGAAALGFRQWLYTSGVVWDTENRGGAAPIPPSLVEEVVRRCERVMIDIQHPDPYMNDVIMGVPGISEMQQESIRLLQEHGVRWLEAQVVPMKVNWRDFPDLVQLLLDRMDFNRVSFLRFVPQGRGEQLKRWLYLTPGEMLELNKMLRRLQREYGEDRVRIGRPLNFCFLFDGDCKPARCRAAFDAPLIQPNGRIDCCPAWKKMPNRVALGNVHDRGLIWSWVASPVAREIRSFVGAPIEEIRDRFKGRCVKCPYFERCRAKCTAQRMLAYNFDWYQTPDPQCPLVRA